MANRRKTDNYILSYWQKISDGSIVVGKWVHLAYKMIVDGFESKRYVFDQKKATAAIEWIEAHCFHVEGKLAPGPLILELWQKALVSAIFGVIDPETNERAFQEIYLVVSRKNGKSLLASAICNYTLQCDGGYGARVYCVAPKLDQADIIYLNTWRMIQLDPKYVRKDEEIRRRREETHSKVEDDPTLVRKRVKFLELPATNSTMMKIAFNAKKSEGFNPSLTICDEVATWEGDAGLKQYDVIKSGYGARPEGLVLSCSTAGYVNDSIYDELMKRSTRLLMGDSKERRLLPMIYQIDDLDKWNDINELRKSNPNLGVSVSVNYLLDEIAVAEGSLAKKAEFLTKYCNIKQNSSIAWLDAPDIDKITGERLSLEDFRDTYAVVGVDLSKTIDLSAVTVVIEKNGVLNVFAKFFLPSEKIQEASARDALPYDIYVKRGLLTPSGDNFIDYKDIYNFLTELVEKYQIYPLKVGYDRYSATYLVQDLKAYGFHCDDVYQGENLSPVINEVEGLIKDGRVKIGDNDLLKVHLLNSAMKRNSETDRRRLVKISQNAHIDGCAALLDAFTVRQKWYGEIGEQLKN